MEDAVTAIIIAFSVLVFVIALSMMMYMVNIVNITSTEILFYSDKSNFIENLRITNPNVLSRDVEFDVIIPTLYRYYKENFCVKFVDGRGLPTTQPKLIHIFDLTLEGQVRSAASTVDFPTKYQQSLNTEYNSPTSTKYLFEAPWLGNINKDVKTRIDLYVSGKAGYINNVKVDYTDSSYDGSSETSYDFSEFDNIKEMMAWYTLNTNSRITETFIEYSFSGDTITAGEGEEVETITGDKQSVSKIIITYTLLD